MGKIVGHSSSYLSSQYLKISSFAVRTSYNLSNGLRSHAPPIPLSLSELTSLERLTIHNTILYSSNFWVSSSGEESIEQRYYESALPAIYTLLETLPEGLAPTLQYLILDTCFELKSRLLPEFDWSSLEQAFALPQCSSLKRIELRVSTNLPLHWEPEDGVELMKSLSSDQVLSKLIDKNLLLLEWQGDKTLFF